MYVTGFALGDPSPPPRFKMLHHLAIGPVVYSWKDQRSCGSDISSCKNEQKKGGVRCSTWA